jgi:DUF1365 family protein
VSVLPTSRYRQLPCLYEVSIHHSRRAPLHNAFQHASYMWLFELEHPPRLPWPLRPFARYRPEDHIDVRAKLRCAGIDARRVVVLTNLRVLGYVFNPISIYWCYDDTGELIAHVAEVHSTYGGRHAYVMPAGTESAEPRPEAVVGKSMFVSPFYPVDGEYRIRISRPDERLAVSVVLERPGDEPFRAALCGRRREPSYAGLLRNLLRYPAAPLRGRALIQLHGLRLWRKGLEVQPR